MQGFSICILCGRELMEGDIVQIPIRPLKATVGGALTRRISIKDAVQLSFNHTYGKALLEVAFKIGIPGWEDLGCVCCDKVAHNDPKGERIIRNYETVFKFRGSFHEITEALANGRNPGNTEEV